MRHKTFFYIMLSIFMLMATRGNVYAESAANWVKKGNQAYDAKKYDDAVKAYDKAGVDAPESALIGFNKGAAFYRKGDWEKAKDAWNLAAQKAKGPLLTARALYNLGNCEYKMAQRQKDSDMQKAVDACTQSIQNYQKALDQLSSIEDEGEGKSDPELKKDAAQNIEIVRLVMKSMLDEINRQKKAAKQARNAANALKKLIDRQKELINRNQYFAQEKGDTPKKDKEISDLAGDQKSLAQDTDKTADAMSVKGAKNSGSQPVPQALPQAASDALSAAKKLLKKAVGDQTSAVKKIGDKNLPDAGTDQAAALDKMEKALNSLKKQASQGQAQSGKKQKQDQSKSGKKAKQKKGEKQDAQKAQAAKKQEAKKDSKKQNGAGTAEKIIEQERERQDRNANRSTGGYSDVDKNW